MEVVGDLIGLDADERGRDAVDGADDLFRRKLLERREVMAGARMPVLPERNAAAHMVLPEARLRFVNAHRAGAPQRRAMMLNLQALIVESMTSFVQHSVK